MISPQLIIIVIIIIVVQYIKTIVIVEEHCYSKSVGFVLFFVCGYAGKRGGKNSKFFFL